MKRATSINAHKMPRPAPRYKRPSNLVHGIRLRYTDLKDAKKAARKLKISTNAFVVTALREKAIAVLGDEANASAVAA